MVHQRQDEAVDQIFPTIGPLPKPDFWAATPAQHFNCRSIHAAPYRTVTVTKPSGLRLTYRTRMQDNWMYFGTLVVVRSQDSKKTFLVKVNPKVDEVNQDTNPKINYVFLEDQLVR